MARAILRKTIGLFNHIYLSTVVSAESCELLLFKLMKVVLTGKMCSGKRKTLIFFSETKWQP